MVKKSISIVQNGLQRYAFFGITIYMHLFFRDFRAFCAFIDTYFLSFLKINKHLFIHNILICFFSAGCHTLQQTAATRLRQRPAQPEARCNRLIRKPIPTIRRHLPGQRRNTPSAPLPSAGQTRKPPVATARAALTQATEHKKRPGSQKPRSHQPQSGNHLAQSQSEEATSIQTNFSCSRR